MPRIERDRRETGNLDDSTPRANQTTWHVNLAAVGRRSSRGSPGFVDAAGIEILRGCNFSDADRPDTQPVAIISEAMARRFWTDGDPVGRLVRRRDADSPWLVVVVASDAHMRTLGEAPRNMIYRIRSGSRDR